VRASVRVAVAGVGHWHGPRHVESLLAAGAKIVGVSDERESVAAKFGSQLDCPAFTDYRPMLEQTRPDFAVVMGRPNETGAMARHLLELCLPFAAEKPLGTCAERVAPLAELERRTGAFAAVALAMRYSPLWQKLDELRSQDRLGTVTHAHFRIVNGPPTRYVRDGVSWMLDPAVAGGGPVMNLGIHCVDAFAWLVSEPVEVVAAQVSYRMRGQRIEDFGTAILRSQGGVIGTVEAGYTYASMGAGGRSSGDREWRVATGNAYLKEDGDHVRVIALDGEETVSPCPSSSSYYTQFAVDTLNRLRQGRPPLATIGDCYRAVQLVDRIYEKAESRQAT